MLLQNLKTHMVQSVRAFRPSGLREAALDLGQHFLYADLGKARGKQEAMDSLCAQFTLPLYCARSFDLLYEVLTDALQRAGKQPGFVLVLDRIPAGNRLDKETREQLLDIFRDACDYWTDKKVPFRCFYSFTVATPSAMGIRCLEDEISEFGEPIPSDKILDISPLALRMSNPFNPSYWRSDWQRAHPASHHGP